MNNQGTEPANKWKSVDESFDQLIAISEKLSRRNRLTPKPAYKGACGVPIPTGLSATLTYRCQCGSVRLKVTPVLVGLHVDHQPTFCLRCGSDQTTFERLEFHSL